MQKVSPSNDSDPNLPTNLHHPVMYFFSLTRLLSGLIQRKWDFIMFILYIFLCVAPPAIYTLVVWLLSGAFVFTLVSTLILAAVSALSLGLLLL